MSDNTQYLKGRIEAVESFCVILSRELVVHQVVVSGVVGDQRAEIVNSIHGTIADNLEEAITLVDNMDQQNEYKKGYIDGMEIIKERIRRVISLSKV